MLMYYIMNTVSFLTAMVLSMIFGGFIATRKWCQKLFIKVTGDIMTSEEYYNMVKDISADLDKVA